MEPEKKYQYRLFFCFLVSHFEIFQTERNVARDTSHLHICCYSQARAAKKMNCRGLQSNWPSAAPGHNISVGLPSRGEGGGRGDNPRRGRYSRSKNSWRIGASLVRRQHHKAKLIKAKSVKEKSRQIQENQGKFKQIKAS